MPERLYSTIITPATESKTAIRASPGFTRNLNSIISTCSNVCSAFTCSPTKQRQSVSLRPKRPQSWQVCSFRTLSFLPPAEFPTCALKPALRSKTETSFFSQTSEQKTTGATKPLPFPVSTDAASQTGSTTTPHRKCGQKDWTLLTSWQTGVRNRRSISKISCSRENNQRFGDTFSVL